MFKPGQIVELSWVHRAPRTMRVIILVNEEDITGTYSPQYTTIDYMLDKNGGGEDVYVETRTDS